ncbi:type VI secretion protein [Vibrio sp. JPW-9-11-11]|uniref:type VI secretion system ImpA family N-terminal domain-containing protein n=1 Tax=Vibrio sp. JPW-9-11-11 TaxID=1416532 RepID=UPI0015949142|nr:type VI secretion system ImpA family N-terminal domain-containing protein [Vibrio sp. JPW-9-11-11]NVD06241.1 type VI secretion protein [Vibrio sp. JPW-9-11-11]
MFFSEFARRPIDENNPSGLNPNGLDDFDEIKRQVNNLNKVTGRVSWKSVQTLSKKILTTHSKDFRCSCYYTVASTHNEGLKGLVEGLNSLLDLCIVYWYSAYPEHSKPNARMSAVEWMVEYVEKRIKKYTPRPEELPLIEAAHQLCLRIEEELRLHYGIKAPSFGRIRRILSQWIEEFKETRKALEATHKPKPTNTEQSVPGIKVEIAPPVKPVEKEKAPEPKSNVATYALIGLILFAFFAHFIHKQYEYSSLTQQISHASLTELSSIVDSLSHENKTHTAALRESTVDRLSSLMTNWYFDPVKVSNIEVIDDLTLKLTRLYPDSSSISQLRENFEAQRKNFEQEFTTIHKRFSHARTVFANIANQNSNKDAEAAYKYSNSLFPLLGRIEYAEKQQEQSEIERSLLLLNTYLYKLQQIKTDKTNNK